MMKKMISLVMAAVMMVCLLSACNVNVATKNGEGEVKLAGTSGKGKNEQGDTGRIEKKWSIVATIFPEYDWVRAILGENAGNVDLTLLLDNGVDLHSFQPAAEDILKISSCDMFIYVGGESDEWVEDVLAEADNKNMVVINLLEVLGDKVKAEEIVEGMEPEHDHEGIGHEDDEHDDEHEEEMDEHVWLSLKNAAILCDAIADGMAKIDAEHAEAYQANDKAYQERLSALHAQYEDVVNDANVKTVLFGDRFPFRYLVDDYGLSYYAAFAGCAAESEASFETIFFLANKADELGLSAIMTIEGKNHKIAETIRDNTSSKDQKIITMDSMQATTAKDAETGVTYLSVMTENLAALQEALQ